MLGELEDLAAIDALALEDGGGVVQRMAQHMRLGLTPGRHFAVQPDEAIAIVEGHQRHRYTPATVFRRPGSATPAGAAPSC
jgi:hypothetical protein